jgi:hypothetical protein
MVPFRCRPVADSMAPAGAGAPSPADRAGPAVANTARPPRELAQVSGGTLAQADPRRHDRPPARLTRQTRGMRQMSELVVREQSALPASWLPSVRPPVLEALYVQNVASE